MPPLCEECFNVETSNNPLQLENCEDNRCYVSKEHTDVSPFYNTQVEFDKHLVKYMQEIIEKKG